MCIQMNKKQILFFGTIITTLLSCNSNSTEKVKNINNDSIDKEVLEIKRLDSMRIAEEGIEREKTRQDSIEESQIKGYSIKKLSGKLKYGGSTKIEYNSLLQILAETEATAEKEMWTKKEKQYQLESYKDVCKGGRIILKIERTTIGGANTEYFTIIVKDLNELELYRTKLDSDIPNTPNSNDYWWNISVRDISQRIKAPFYVYVVDAIEKETFKFEVTPQ